MTSDIIRIPTFPGKSNCDTLKITMKVGRSRIMDQRAAIGNAEYIASVSGNFAPKRKMAKIIENTVLAKYTNVVSGNIGVLFQRFKDAPPIDQQMPDKIPNKSPMFTGKFDS